MYAAETNASNWRRRVEAVTCKHTGAFCLVYGRMVCMDCAAYSKPIVSRKEEEIDEFSSIQKDIEAKGYARKAREGPS